MTVLDRIYQRSPQWIQSAGVAVYGAAWYRRRFGRGFREAVKEIAERDRWPAARWAEYQERRLRVLIEEALRSPHYSRVLASLDLSAPMLPQLRSVPTLTKETLRVDPKALLTRDPGRRTMVLRSSGTTGTPTEIYYTRSFHQLTQAFFESRVRNRAGVTHRDRRVMFGARKVCKIDRTEPPFWRRNPAENMIYCSIYHLSPTNLPSYLEMLRAYAPEVVMGYPNALNIVARSARDAGIPLPPARAILTTSETVTPEIRETVSAAWGCKISDSYGAVEGCMLASECEEGRYHLSPDAGIVEILNEDGDPCAPGEIGRVVCTGLQNLLQPLIRYEIGDVASWSEEETCPCGRSTPLMRSIEGRSEDMCTTPDGRAILRFDTVFKGIAGIREAQVEQVSLDRFILRVVDDPEFTEAQRRAMVENMYQHVGKLQIDVETVDRIPRSSSGKFRPVISRVARP